ncbi:hypothetical protein DK389_26790 [Methylobacterium durans]|uniref:Uncharacterized protein n=1 Tax=Methylobacterium durans TaxID=2202825 RepID=A0A2U8WBM4_9HYPH|nr:hypothetical protein DK389_26790 [Methylobacterium durans]
MLPRVGEIVRSAEFPGLIDATVIARSAVATIARNRSDFKMMNLFTLLKHLEIEVQHDDGVE